MLELTQSKLAEQTEQYQTLAKKCKSLEVKAKMFQNKVTQLQQQQQASPSTSSSQSAAVSASFTTVKPAVPITGTIAAAPKITVAAKPVIPVAAVKPAAAVIATSSSAENVAPAVSSAQPTTDSALRPSTRRVSLSLIKPITNALPVSSSTAASSTLLTKRKETSSVSVGDENASPNTNETTNTEALTKKPRVLANSLTGAPATQQ